MGGGCRLGAQLTNAPGAWNFSDLHTADPAAATAFYGAVFGWEISDLGFATMIRRPGYGDHLASTVDPGIHERQDAVVAPPGFADAIGWLAPSSPTSNRLARDLHGRRPRRAVAAVERLGGAVLVHRGLGLDADRAGPRPGRGGLHGEPVHAADGLTSAVVLA